MMAGGRLGSVQRVEPLRFEQSMGTIRVASRKEAR